MLDVPNNKYFSDNSALAIILANALTIVLAIYQDWNLQSVMMIYWLQSVIIGASNFVRIIMLDKFSTEGMRINGRPVEETTFAKWYTAIFFVIHYGFFHFGYLEFIYTSAEVDLNHGYEVIYDKINADLNWIAVAVLVFAVGHLISLYKNIAEDLKNRPNLGTIMFLPYGRILPMHLTIFLGSFFVSDGAVMILFLLIKAGVDLLAHGFEHALLQKIT